MDKSSLVSSDPPPYSYGTTPNLGPRVIMSHSLHRTQPALIPPRTYIFERYWFSSARVYIQSPEQNQQPLTGTYSNSSYRGSQQGLISDDLPSFNPFKWCTTIVAREVGNMTDDSRGPPAYCLLSRGGRYMLYDGPGPSGPGSSREVLDIKTERCWNTTSTYTEVEGQHRETSMSKEVWWSTNRVMKDFDGAPYKWTSSWFDDLDCVRTDGIPFAHFQKAKFALWKMGELEVKQPVSPELLYLLLGACMVKFREDEKRRHRSSGHHGG
ncbi:hypothetical protein FRB99_008490 [Tulasnella sp. 403]|nr:hypothetical protein FRB99_008490 [Tulasnella sp. 403]